MLMECVRFEQYIADKIDSGSEMPAKPVIIPDILQEVRQPRLWLPFATQPCLLRRGLKSAVTTLPGSEIGVCKHHIKRGKCHDICCNIVETALYPLGAIECSRRLKEMHIKIIHLFKPAPYLDRGVAILNIISYLI